FAPALADRAILPTAWGGRYFFNRIGLYLLIAAIRWPLERAWKNRRHPSQDAEDEPTLRQMLQPELMPDVDTRTDEHGDRRMRIEPRL
ncbi:MFS transporter, partial [Pseudomonas aeruginosa]